ncbi:MAG: hypothetical protein Q4D90_04400 [bacterium]|nr:hypothetical protein [bacterium]
MIGNKWRKRWMSCKLEALHFFEAVGISLLYVAALVLENEKLERVALLLGFFFVLLFLLHKNLHAQYRFLKLHRSFDHLPVKQMRRVNAVFISGFLVVTSVLMGLLPFFRLGSLLRPLRQGILYLLRWLLQGLEAGESETVAAQSPMGAFGGFPPLEEYEASWLSLLLEGLLEIIGYALLLLVLVYLLYALYRSLCRLFQAREFDDDEKVFLAPTFFGESIKASNKQEKKKLWRDFSYSGRVRRHYKRMVQKRRGKKQSIPPAAAPREIEQLLQFGGEKELLHLLYEKARYSREGCEKAEWELLERERRHEE